jgi:hypothetical protein
MKNISQILHLIVRKAARDAVGEYKAANKIATENMKSSSEDAQKRFRVDSSSSEAQEKTMAGTLSETKREFKKLNEPYLLISVDSSFYTFIDVTDNFMTKSQLENLKEFPAQLINISSSVGFTPSDNPNPDSILRSIRNQSKVVNSFDGSLIYAVKGSPTSYRRIWGKKEGLDVRTYPAFKQQILEGKIKYVLAYEITYLDVVSKAYRKYDCVMMVTIASGGRILTKYLKNKNFDCEAPK